jgi:D-lyxose ketol-isomerase
MNRSEINGILKEAEEFLARSKFFLPPWAYWRPEEWNEKAQDAREIIENLLGWDITDFGSGNFEKRGLLLFTLRNGNPSKDRKTYAEKIMIVKEGQETPMHCHARKMEDIINRGGGNLVIELNNSSHLGELAETTLYIRTDGIQRRIEPGTPLVLTPGESIALVQGMYHRFYGEKGNGPVLVGEVSAVNDDVSDNYFLEEVGRFPEIVEDEKPFHLMVSDYSKWI